MNKYEKENYVMETEDYLEKNNVYSVFEELMNQVILNKPDDPITFLKKYLQNPIGKFIFIIGPPGSDVRELALLLSSHFDSVIVSVGDLLKKEVNKKTEKGLKIEEDIKNLLYVQDSLIIDILYDHLKTINQNKNIIIEGFPKTIYQSKYLLNKGIIPSAIIVVNYSIEKCIDYSM